MKMKYLVFGLVAAWMTATFVGCGKKDEVAATVPPPQGCTPGTWGCNTTTGYPNPIDPGTYPNGGTGGSYSVQRSLVGASIENGGLAFPIAAGDTVTLSASGSFGAPTTGRRWGVDYYTTQGCGNYSVSDQGIGARYSVNGSAFTAFNNSYGIQYVSFVAPSAGVVRVALNASMNLNQCGNASVLVSVRHY